MWHQKEISTQFILCGRLVSHICIASLEFPLLPVGVNESDGKSSLKSREGVAHERHKSLPIVTHIRLKPTRKQRREEK